ncbi:TetR/AcrR family transcriptional regulator [Tenggerimyces flavus]|uniref:TetR/AcrR family transcriptional regulator n=1 Tax=Tenggerimyces flavus TaxID=1708749 RepID=A0ABV7YGV0_9ACTN|nr:TetR/AcrR family transcriptional regulator [Tenggerimyces flavus]MBM7787834.1 AcrR family transcriptional regulator [Tenggerimyces flavus]
MIRSETAESGTRGRTRRAILSASVSVLGRNRSATLADIADAAEVGRSTLHRYFADRDELVRATVDESFAAIGRAIEEAEIGEGPAIDGLRRLVAGMVEVGDQLIFLFGDSGLFDQYAAETGDDPREPDADEVAVIALIERGQAEGTIDPNANPRWIYGVLWGMVYTGVEAANEGTLPRHGIGAAVIRMIERGIQP